MSILGIETLVYVVEDLDTCTRFFTDFGLVKNDSFQGEGVQFVLPEGSKLELRTARDASHPASRIEGPGVHEVIWGVDSQNNLERLAAGLGLDVLRDDDGTVRFASPFGVPMGLRVYDKKPVVTAPDPINSPGRINRMNHHRKWRTHARPRGIAHVVFAVPDYEEGYLFMRDRLGFRLVDSQAGFGKYLRADGSTAHHALLLLNANAHIPGMDGKLRFHHANFPVEDIDEIMVGANHMTRKGWEASHQGLGRHRIDSALFYYIPCPAGGEAEYGTDQDCADDSWVPRHWINPLFGYAHFVSNLPPFLMDEPGWDFRYITDGDVPLDNPDLLGGD